MLLADENVVFRGYSGARSETRCRIFTNAGQLIFVVTEVPGNPGLSVTNAWGLPVDLGEQLLRRMSGLTMENLDPAKVVWIEHYPARDGMSESFDRVLLTWDGRQYHMRENCNSWRRIFQPEFEKLIGEKFTE